MRTTTWEVPLDGKTWLSDEPSIEEILGDPIVRLLMRRDGVTVDELCESLQLPVETRRRRSFEEAQVA